MEVFFFIYSKYFSYQVNPTGSLKKWRDDGKCGREYPLSNGNPTECDPDGDKPCCDRMLYGTCGNTVDQCYVNYSRLYGDWRKSGGKQKWRYDGRRGKDNPLPDGTMAECNPDGEKPCSHQNRDYCTSYIQNDRSLEDACWCPECVDYRVVQRVRQTGQKCVLVKMDSGFLQYICIEEKKKIQQYFKCAYSDVYYVQEKIALDPGVVSRVCQDDPHVYQACGIPFKKENVRFTNNEAFCGGYFCKTRMNYHDTFPQNKFTECTGEACRAENRDCRKPHDPVTNSLCDEKCDEMFCDDESNCNGFKYGVACSWITGPEEGAVTRDGYRQVCDGFDDCSDVSDVVNCKESVNTYLWCTQYDKMLYYNSTQTVPLLKSIRCRVLDASKSAVRPFCLNYLDQTNCSDIERVGGFCKVNGFMASVSKFMVCKKFDEKSLRAIKLCDDDMQNKCVTPYSQCEIHKHLLCDGKKDCFDESDEFNDECQTRTDKFGFNCTRRFQHRIGSGPIPLSWVMDNVTDCMDGQDEDTSFWKFCTGNFKMLSSSKESCPNVFKCPGKTESYVLFELLCDGVESCDDDNHSENMVCQIAREFPVINSTALYNGTIKNVCSAHSSSCKKGEYKRSWGYVFGEPKIELYVPISKINCSRVFGEHYLFLSCMNLCLEKDAICLITGGNRQLEYDSCPGQYPNRTYTVTNNSFLTFLEESHSGQYHQDIFRCNNDRCVEYTRVCDLIDDCGDMSDELSCINHMVCKDTLNSTKKQFISLSQKCDGIYDCFDLSDECNEECGKEILENWFIKIICWSMGLLALFFNSLSVMSGFTSLKDCKTGQMMTSKALMSLIGIGDFLIGLYLVILSVYDAVIGQQFCERQAEWLTGETCMILGVISTLGSQISLFTMTVLSVIRMYGLTCKPMRVPGPYNKKGVFRIISLGAATIGISLLIAVTPLAPELQDYFVQGIYYDGIYKVFVGFKNKNRLIKILQSYYKNSTTNFSNKSISMSWNEIAEKVNGMFNLNSNLTSKSVHFYGNDGVCLFKYFVRTDDAKRSRLVSETEADLSGFKGDPVVWTMLAVNFMCFIVITFCYILIIYHTKTSSQRSGQQENPERQAEEEATQRRIMIIIATDFLCWVPFIVICVLHNLEYIDASLWYASFTMTVLPLNSVINPILYDKGMQEMLKRKLDKLNLKEKIVTLYTTVMSAVSSLFRSSSDEKNEQTPEIIAMKQIGEVVNDNDTGDNDGA